MNLKLKRTSGEFTTGLRKSKNIDSFDIRIARPSAKNQQLGIE
jgi:hypothetical protein